MSLSRVLGKPKGKQSFKIDSRWVLPECLIGLEHEYEGVKDRTLPIHSFSELWSYHEETSLKDLGAEYVLSNPLFGEDLSNALQWMTDHAVGQKWKCTKRTGIHVHMDVRDLEVPQLAGLSLLYAALEPLIYKWVGDSRDVSHFCVPLYKADDALFDACSIIRSAFQDQKAGSSLTLKKSEDFKRYAGFNLHALHKFGSIEFRHLQTTHDRQRIEDWINILMAIKA